MPGVCILHLFCNVAHLIKWLPASAKPSAFVVCLSPVGSCLRIGKAFLRGVGGGCSEATRNVVLAAQYRTDKHERGYQEVKVDVMR